MIGIFAVVANVRVGWKAFQALKDPSERRAFETELRRFSIIASHVPPHAVIGYASGKIKSSDKDDKQLYLAQYELAPRLVKPARRDVDWLLMARLKNDPEMPDMVDQVYGSGGEMWFFKSSSEGFQNLGDLDGPWQIPWRDDDFVLYHRVK